MAKLYRVQGLEVTETVQQLMKKVQFEITYDLVRLD